MQILTLSQNFFITNQNFLSTTKTCQFWAT